MFAEIIPEYLVICEEVYFEDLLLPYENDRPLDVLEVIMDRPPSDECVLIGRNDVFHLSLLKYATHTWNILEDCENHKN